MYFINPLTMMQQTLMAQPGGPPAPAPQYLSPYSPPVQQMISPTQQLLPQMQNNPAPSYYGPVHQKLSDYFNAGSMWRSDFPRYVNQLMFQPELRNMHGGFQFRDIIAPQPNNDWRIDWFAEDRAKAAAAAAAAANGAAGGAGLLQSWQNAPDTGVRAGQNDVGGA